MGENFLLHSSFFENIYIKNRSFVVPLILCSAFLSEGNDNQLDLFVCLVVRRIQGYPDIHFIIGVLNVLSPLIRNGPEVITNQLAGFCPDICGVLDPVTISLTGVGRYKQFISAELEVISRAVRVEDCRKF